jgi:hypothetical protein
MIISARNSYYLYLDTRVLAAIMNVWVVIIRVPEIEARSVDKIFDSKEKADKYVTDQEEKEMLANMSGFEYSVEEWEVE